MLEKLLAKKAALLELVAQCDSAIKELQPVKIETPKKTETINPVISKQGK